MLTLRPSARPSTSVWTRELQSSPSSASSVPTVSLSLGSLARVRVMRVLCAGTLFQQEYFTCDWWFNVDCHHHTTLLSDSFTPSPSDSPSVRVDTIYSAIKAANEKYESQHYRGSRPVRQILSSELRLARRRTNYRNQQKKNIASGRRRKPRYKQKQIFFL